MVLATKPLIRCPFCKESIIEGAIKCKHCRSELPRKKTSRSLPITWLNTFRTGFITGILFTLILVILMCRHFA